ncbi:MULTISPECIES: hypothetical protein [Nostoc]|uniref:hypothetical protein n=1 Tax=Nostoc TaxID=1177 RepID=UPI0018EFD780|nr:MULTISPECIES: hypothetical protein [Nostoc]
MSHQSKINISLMGAVFLSLLVTPVLAHNIKLSGDVAGTWHVEPNHSPKAGETARVWIALTRKGGKILPVSEANCQMAVYSQPRKQKDSPVLQPTVQAISVERYQGIPGADVVFPKTGAYQLELGCTPKVESNFKPFQMQYEVIVASGVAASTPAPVTSSQKTEQELSSSQSTNSGNQWFTGAMALGVMIAGLGTFWWMKQRVKVK